MIAKPFLKDPEFGLRPDFQNQFESLVSLADA